MSQPARRALTTVSWLALGLAIADLAARSLARHGLLGDPGVDRSPAIAGAAVLAAALLVWISPTARARLFAVFGALYAAGIACQQQLGARLQSDGVYYFAYLRSLWFDRDVNFLNDYRLLGLSDKPYLFEPTVTGHAHSAWTIGPAIVWAPFFAIGHGVALWLSRHGAQVAVDGTSYPYRQAVCLAGLFYGLLGVYFCMRIAAYAVPRVTAAAAAALGIAGSFMLWYLVKEPTMTHAPSMAAVAAFIWLWMATCERRSWRQWVALGALGGLMALIRWQNAIYGVLPLSDFLIIGIAAIRTRDRTALLRLTGAAAAGLVAAIAAFLPQMLAWKAIYGAYIAVSPIGPQIRLGHPHLVEILWSSHNGLFAFSPVLYVGAFGLPVLISRHRHIGVACTIAFIAMIYFNSTIQDWWGSAGFGGRRFDGAVPILIIGLALVLDVARRMLARASGIPGGVLIAGALLWAATCCAAARAQVFLGTQPNDFGRVGAAQAETLHRWFGHPFSYPANIAFAIANNAPIGDYDLVDAGSFLGDPTRPYGRIDFGEPSSAVYVRNGLSDPERDGSTTFRVAGERAGFIVPLRRTPPLRVQLRLRAMGPAATVVVRINGAPFGPFIVASDWRVIAFVTNSRVWRTTVNQVALEFDRAEPGAAAVSYFRISEEGR